MRLEDHRARATICVTIESRCGFRRAFPPVTSSLESGRRHIAGAAQTSQSASDPMGGMGETQCERAHIGSIDTNAGLQVPCNPASSLERATGIEPATSSLGSWLCRACALMLREKNRGAAPDTVRRQALAHR